MPSPSTTSAARRLLPPALLLAAAALVVLVVSPTYEVPQNDDWAYYLVIERWFETGRIEHLGWNDPALLFQVVWGGAFASIFGLSYTVLRASTLVLALVGVLSTYGILRRCALAPAVAAFGAATLLFDPLFLLLGYSFNTDVPYLGLATLATWVFLIALERRSTWLCLVGGVVASAAFLVRQPALLIPLVVSGYVLFRWETPRSRRALAAVLASAPAAVALLLHASWIRAQTSHSWLENASNLHPFLTEPSLATFGDLVAAAGLNTVAGLMTLGLCCVPCILLAWPEQLRLLRRSRTARWWLAAAVVVFAGVAWTRLADQPEGLQGWPYQGNYLTRLGPLPQYPVELLAPPWVWTALTLLTPVLGAWVVGSLATLAATSHPGPASSARTLVLATAAAQFLPGLLQAEFYDRYLLTLLPGVVVLVAPRTVPRRPAAILGGLSLALLAVVSTEYLRVYVDRSGAGWHLAESAVEMGVGPEEIALGFEWEGAHLYLRARAERGARSRFDLAAGYPWDSLTRHRYFVREFPRAPGGPSETYRAFLSARRTVLGFLRGP